MSIHSLIHNTTFKLRKYILPKKMDANEAQEIIYNLLKSNSPCMIGRFGSVEIQGVINGISPWPLHYILKKRTYKYLINNAGFFPTNRSSVKRFAKLMIKSMRCCDCLASWRIEEFFFRGKLKRAKKVSLDSLMPVNPEINVEYKWGKALENKKVLVISPFAELIEAQYHNKRQFIWESPNMLPLFKELHTLKSVNSVGGKKNCNFETWFDALEYMQKEIDKIDFDIAILGCGAYGFPLAAYIKNKGKKAIHIGGATQLLFGIKGKRWEGAPFINENWVSPRVEDRPKGFENVEGGCYW